MEYIEKENLILNEIYTHENGNIVKYEYLNNFNQVCGKFIGGNKNNFCSDMQNHAGRFNIDKLRLPTPQEKHWLESCIKLDKFISFNEAMKTFDDFILPKKWLLKVTNENRDCINLYRKLHNRNELTHYSIYNYISYNKGEGWLSSLGGEEITFEQFKKYVLKEKTIEKVEELPQFKIIETIETIIKVENNEGSLFMIGDIVKSESNQKGKILNFKYSADKSNIIAITEFQRNNGININKIEHFIEVKSDLKTAINIAKHSTYGAYPLTPEECYSINESLLDKAKRLYPVGTKFKSASSNEDFTVKNHNKQNCNNIVFDTIESGSQNYYYGCVYSVGNNKWAEIIEYPHGFKVGDKIISKYDVNRNFTWKIIKIEGNQLIFESNGLPKINSILAKNAIKVN